jgi:hypothetical protein
MLLLFTGWMIFTLLNFLLGSWVSSFFMDPFLLAAFIPIKIYSNAESDKALILKENKNKSGIYMWKNSINDKRYRKRKFLSVLFEA